MKRLKFGLILVVFGMAGIWFFNQQSSVVGQQGNIYNPNSAPPGEASATLSSPAESSSSPYGSSGSAKASDSPEDPKFRDWIVRQAKYVDSPNANSVENKKEVERAIREMTRGQARQLLLIAQSPDAPAREKILATYLLVEGGSLSLPDLAQLIATPLPNTGPATAHSEAEAVGIREKSLRIMAIDGLFSLAEKDDRARATLKETIPSIQDTYVRSYAQKRFDELKPR